MVNVIFAATRIIKAYMLKWMHYKDKGSHVTTGNYNEKIDKLKYLKVPLFLLKVTSYSHANMHSF